MPAQLSRVTTFVRNLDDRWSAEADRILEIGSNEGWFRMRCPSKRRPRRGIFASCDGVVIGALDYVIFGRRQRHRWMRVVSMSVIPDYRNRGAASAMLDLAHSIAVRNGCYLVEALVSPFNFQSIAALKKANFDGPTISLSRTIKDHRSSDPWD